MHPWELCPSEDVYMAAKKGATATRTGQNTLKLLILDSQK